MGVLENCIFSPTGIDLCNLSIITILIWYESYIFGSLVTPFPNHRVLPDLLVLHECMNSSYPLVLGSSWINLINFWKFSLNVAQHEKCHNYKSTHYSRPKFTFTNSTLRMKHFPNAKFANFSCGPIFLYLQYLPVLWSVKKSNKI